MSESTKPLEVGDRVIRGARWRKEDRDKGGRGHGIGTVIGFIDGGMVRVSWQHSQNDTYISLHSPSELAYYREAVPVKTEPPAEPAVAAYEEFVYFVCPICNMECRTDKAAAVMALWKHVKDSHAPTATAQEPSPGTRWVPSCGCHRCLKERDERIGGIPTAQVRMIVCGGCGNKRCPHASDHRYQCTGSNDPGHAAARILAAATPSQNAEALSPDEAGRQPSGA